MIPRAPSLLWLDKTLACSVNRPALCPDSFCACTHCSVRSNHPFTQHQVFARGNAAPLTEYFIWPRSDAWEDMKGCLESKPWVGDAEKVALLNRLTGVSSVMLLLLL